MRRIAVLLTSVGLSLFGLAGTSHADDAYPPQEPTTTTTVEQLPPPPTTVPAHCVTNGTGHGTGYGAGQNCPHNCPAGSVSSTSGSSTTCVAILPVTGSDSASTLQIAVISVAAGIGLVAVAGARRRKPARTPA
ncbi:MAG: hypothetical protein JWL72_2801 [Ilumatobacteraceae bacterium]|nr:hypothetical protein [Ilumatobacteraceae bacterium]MCU1389463.1 hypothetical protein [Ilumatobacteraceae bacterium]